MLGKKIDIRFGKKIQTDERLKEMLSREFHFVTALARGASLHGELFHLWAAARALCNRPSVARCAFILVVYVAVAAGCAASDPDDDDSGGGGGGGEGGSGLMRRSLDRFCDGGPTVGGQVGLATSLCLRLSHDLMC